jgi:hypothetical protein
MTADEADKVERALRLLGYSTAQGYLTVPSSNRYLGDDWSYFVAAHDPESDKKHIFWEAADLRKRLGVGED